jgi:hypothetical protein
MLCDEEMDLSLINMLYSLSSVRIEATATANRPAYKMSAWTAQKTPFVCLLFKGRCLVTAVI